MAKQKSWFKKIEEKEWLRQSFHIMYGIVVLILLKVFHQNIVAIFLLLLSLLGFIISFTSKKKNIWFITKMLDVFDRKEDRKDMPGKGAITLTIGFFLSLLLFENRIAKAAILILALGDSFSTLGGKAFGKIILRKPKTLEGSLTGVIAATIGSTIFYIPLLPAVVASLIAIMSEHLETKILDDNILIPVIAGIILSIML
jgi:dolichol kinase